MRAEAHLSHPSCPAQQRRDLEPLLRGWGWFGDRGDVVTVRGCSRAGENGRRFRSLFSSLSLFFLDRTEAAGLYSGVGVGGVLGCAGGAAGPWWDPVPTRVRNVGARAAAPAPGVVWFIRGIRFPLQINSLSRGCRTFSLPLPFVKPQKTEIKRLVLSQAFCQGAWGVSRSLPGSCPPWRWLL